MKKLIGFGFITALIFSSMVKAADNYIVNTKVYNIENLISAPILTVASSKEAKFIVDDLYRLSLYRESDSIVKIKISLEKDGKNISKTLAVELDKEVNIYIDGKVFSFFVDRV
ncbi:hypothetical protein [Photobacterium leiognathi]|uniref:hypothetical protein n=1 Tax=Photobacterium leiognathi TaxID=553611 RepID=UPI00273358A2|nr:hypothetical protein [Photobacterium leiognathi]